MTTWSDLEIEREDHAEHAIAVYRFVGSLVDNPTAYKFLGGLRREVSDSPTPINVIFDIEGVETLNSGGVGILAASYASITGADGRLCVVGAGRRAKAVMQVVGLLKVMECYESEAEAVEALTQGS